MKNNTNKEEKSSSFQIDWFVILLVATLIYFGWSAYLDYKTADNKVTIANSKIVIGKDEDNSRYIVLNYENGKVVNEVFVNNVRDDKKHKQVICECAETGDVYIFSYPVSITDVTYTKDYIKWSKSQH